MPEQATVQTGHAKVSETDAGWAQDDEERAGTNGYENIMWYCHLDDKDDGKNTMEGRSDELQKVDKLSVRAKQLHNVLTIALLTQIECPPCPSCVQRSFLSPCWCRPRTQLKSERRLSACHATAKSDCANDSM